MALEWNLLKSGMVGMRTGQFLNWAKVLWKYSTMLKPRRWIKLKLASATVPSDPAQITLGNASVNASMAFNTYFDNFKINSGLTTYIP
jgi:hypothetical protein